jgi:hypothetical protein
MKMLIITILIFTITGCTSRVNTDLGNENEQENNTKTAPLNKSNKWKADQATKTNVAAMVQVVNDNSYASATKRKQLYTNLQGRIDTLIKQCNMKGAEHDALHVWLQKVIKDLEELKEDDDDRYGEAYVTVKNDIEAFYTSFE